MKIRLFISLIFLVSGSTAFSLKVSSEDVSFVEPIRGCTFQIEPIIRIESNGRVSGPLIDYFLHHVEPELGRPIEWQGLNVARLLSNLKEGGCDFAPLLSYSEERARYFNYLEPYFLQLRPVLVVLDSYPLHTVLQQEDLYGMTIGWSSQSLVPVLLQSPKINIDALSQRNWEHGNMQKLLRGRIDAALFSNDISANYFRAQFPVNTKIIYLPVSPLHVHVVLGKKWSVQNSSVAETIQRVIKEKPFSSVLEGLDYNDVR